MAFQEKIASLQVFYRLQHDLNNQIAGAEFAGEKGELSDEERKNLARMKSEYEQRATEIEIVREQIKSEFPDNYSNHLKALHTKLTAIQNYLVAMKGDIEFKHSFNKTLCESLLSDLSKLIQNKKTKYDLNWLFDVSASLLEEYKIALKL